MVQLFDRERKEKPVTEELQDQMEMSEYSCQSSETSHTNNLDARFLKINNNNKLSIVLNRRFDHFIKIAIHVPFLT